MYCSFALGLETFKLLFMKIQCVIRPFAARGATVVRFILLLPKCKLLSLRNIGSFPLTNSYTTSVLLYPNTSKLKFQIKLVTVRNTADQDGYELFALPTITADTSCTSHCSHYFHFYKDLNEQLRGLKPIQNPKQRKYL